MLRTRRHIYGERLRRQYRPSEGAAAGAGLRKLLTVLWTGIPRRRPFGLIGGSFLLGGTR